jgi:V8-like Glu-specific endopeptidase
LVFGKVSNPTGIYPLKYGVNTLQPIRSIVVPCQTQLFFHFTTFSMETSKPRSIAKKFRGKFSRPEKPLANLEAEADLQGDVALESMPSADAEPPSEFSEADIAERIGYSKETLYKYIEQHLGNDPKMKELADKIFKDAPDHMRAVANDDDEHLEQFPEATDVLEVIVETDGSRPSFMIKNGEVDFTSSPVGDWGDVIVNAGDKLKQAIECTGRINNGESHIGTGFLIHRNFIITNRHVLQAIGMQKNDGSWELRSDANIDFGHEFNGVASRNRRKLKSLIYTGPQKVTGRPIDHSILDLALIQLVDAPDENVPQHLLSWNKSRGWTFPGMEVFIIGYPGDPRLSPGMPADYTPPLLDQLFQTQFGCKRLAPGKIMERDNSDLDWTMKHDATTLGGNSGSVIVPLSGALKASALHYGGASKKPRENWGHILGLVLEAKDAQNKPLQEFLQKNNVVIATDE